jgi:hypothetical protein
MFTRFFGNSARNASSSEGIGAPGVIPGAYFLADPIRLLTRVDAGFGGDEEARVCRGVLHIGQSRLARKAIEHGNFRYLNFLLAAELRPPHVLHMAGSAATSPAKS